jgi:hypothetical protein
MSSKKRQQRASAETSRHLSALLDEALEETFPASDPVAINVEPIQSKRDVLEQPKDQVLMKNSD